MWEGQALGQGIRGAIRECFQRHEWPELSLRIFATACLVQVVRTRGKCIGIVLFRKLVRKKSVELLHFLARPRDGVLVHYLFCERMKATAATDGQLPAATV